MENKVNIAGVLNGIYYWNTTHYHPDNSFTMNEFIEDHLQDDADVYLQDGSYAEVRVNSVNYSLNAKGSGDCYNHIVEWEIV